MSAPSWWQRWLLGRLREPSTWRGLILLLAAGGVALRPEVADAIIALCLALAGGVGVVTADAPREPARPAGRPSGSGAPPAPGPRPGAGAERVRDAASLRLDGAPGDAPRPRRSGFEDLDRLERWAD